MAEGNAEIAKVTPKVDSSADLPIRIDLSQELTEPKDDATPQQVEAYNLGKRYREIVGEAGEEPNRGTRYIEAALAQMGYEHAEQPGVDEKIAIKLKHPDYDFGPSLTPENDHAIYLRKLQP